MTLRAATDRRVVVTGIGMVTPLGLDRESSFGGIIAGRSGAAGLVDIDLDRLPITFGCQVKEFDPEVGMDRRTARRTDRFVQMAVAAAREACADAGLDVSAHPEPHRIGTSVATGIGGLHTLHVAEDHLFRKGPDRMSPMWITMLIPNMASGMISMELGTRGPAAASCTACAASSMAIGDAASYIRDNRCDAMIVGGTEAPITQVGIGGFFSMRAISMRNDDPERASRPFDLERDGFVVGEGAGILILESLEHAQKRDAEILAEIVGYGMSGDAYHITQPAENGDGAYRVMKAALKDAKLSPDDIGYVNAHGTSTPLGDALETIALKRVFGDRAKKVPVSSTKSMTGHLLGGAGGLEAGISVLALRDQTLPPTINQETPDPACDLDYVPNVARKTSVDYALSNSFGFGGTNAALIFKRWTGK